MLPSTSYVFTAFSENDLVPFGGAKRGTEFSVSDLTSVKVGILDQDRMLSGLDSSGQVRDKIGQVAREGDTDQFHVASHMIVADADGNRYRMVEIGQQGDGDDVFTFSGATPDPTGTLTVLRVIDRSNPGVLYDRLGLGEDDRGGSISGRYFCDDDYDGVQGPDDPGVENMLVSLLDSSGRIVARTTTGADGTYGFTDLEADIYVVMFASEPTKDFVSPDRGNDDTTDSDVTDLSRGTTDRIVLNEGQAISDIDAGIAYPADDFIF